MITISNVSKNYRGKKVLDRVNLTIPDGAATYLLGPNGAGKSTLIRLIGGTIRLSSGRIIINGKKLSSYRDVIRQIGFLCDFNSFNPFRSARNHLTALARLGGVSVKRVDLLLDFVGLAAEAHKKIGSFSLGMLQRLGIAVALLGDPQTLVFDEPTNCLDIDGILWLRKLILTFVKEGRCLLVSSHLLDEVNRIADRIVILGKGKIIVDQTLSELVAVAGKHFSLESVYLEKTADL